ncbi:AGAP013140-PA [Anopheles gambiae str. PEST]|uniref:AGAP013140-PA n=1 Tax=Anopheles gambiae TaxID=7165 RepID=F5HLT9_ANOGA|nr:AGAP013140-PA [Anopheles gambiae str. PEST]
METDLAYEVLADYSLQETPFYEAPTPTAAVSVNFYPPPNDIQSPHQSGPQQSRSLNNTARCYDTAFDLSLTTSMLTGKMQLMNTGSATTSGPSVGAIGASGGIHQNNHQNQHQTGMALVPMGVSNLSSGSSLTSSICSGGNGEGLTRPKKMKKSVSFLPTFVQVSNINPYKW